MKKDETTFELTDMERKERWKYYTSSFVRIEPTEGLNRTSRRYTLPVLTRNLPSGTDTDSDSNSPLGASSALQLRKPLFYSEELVLQICVNTYQLMYKKGTSEWFIYGVGEDGDRARAETERRNQRFREKWELNPRWGRGKTRGEVEATNLGFERWVKEGVVPDFGAGAHASGRSGVSVPAAANVDGADEMVVDGAE
jgi:paired amphipathic helix protein Sin3a